MAGLEVGEEVDVRGGGSFPPCDGAEEMQMRDACGLKLRGVLAQGDEDALRFHRVLIVAHTGWGRKLFLSWQGDGLLGCGLLWTPTHAG